MFGAPPERKVNLDGLYSLIWSFGALLRWGRCSPAAAAAQVEHSARLRSGT
jgi:hypothetical protein